MSSDPTGWQVYRGTGDAAESPTAGAAAVAQVHRYRRGEASGRRRAEVHRRIGALPRTPRKPQPLEVLMVNAAIYLRRPLLVTGDPGTRKSSLAYLISRELGLGPTLRWPITSRTVLKDGLYLYDAIGRVQAAANLDAGEGESGVGDYVHLGPLGTALLPCDLPRVLLIDELDKGDIDLPNDLLNVFEEGEYDILGLVRLARKQADPPVFTADRGGSAVVRNGAVRCRQFPIVIITSNGEREFPPAFLRRCLRLHFEAPDFDQLGGMVAAHLGETEDVDLAEAHRRLPATQRAVRRTRLGPAAQRRSPGGAARDIRLVPARPGLEQTADRDLAPAVVGGGMSRPPRDERTPVDTSAGFGAVVLQQFVPANGPDRPLCTSDLTYREVRDRLWLARQLHRPDPAAPSTSPSPPPVEEPVAPAATNHDEPGQEAPEQDSPAETSTPAQEQRDAATTQSEASTAAGEENWTPGPARVQPIPVGGGATTSGEAALAWPTVPALSEPRRIATALRPFTRPAPSPWRTVLDEEATAVRAAQEGLWLPEWRPAPWRRFDVVLVADAAPSMEIWQQTVQDLLTLLRRQGAFRNVRFLRVHMVEPDLALDVGDPAPVPVPVVSTPEEPAEQLTARTRVMRFRTQASVQAFHLAGPLAATPLSLPLIKLVQRIMLPDTNLSALAELVLSRLLKTPTRQWIDTRSDSGHQRAGRHRRSCAERRKPPYIGCRGRVPRTLRPLRQASNASCHL
ncbi:hypothetical protein SK803_15760 [Lentzea sp. BCCO 10_0856]|uniref:AAA domain (Dynein-related subfamily) n=1 Tax=Lentzea miocenica TaxID=3095431 RepID=A0ABU4T0K1_9PSEU|nr:hypothetical protein [Lentzea sp. BCCO 10_0856]MDX8031681.1 hypothetical protein [Lentzea sp. BCCO 10_0856]